MPDRNSHNTTPLSLSFTEPALPDRETLLRKTAESLRNQGVNLDQAQLMAALRQTPLADAFDSLQTALATAQTAALTDSMTGLPNRAGVMKLLHQQFQERGSGVQNNDLVLVFIDLDGFKDLNDNCGHDYGDHALRRVARRLSAQFADVHGIVGRLGGDEMVIILPADPHHDEHHEIRAEIDQALDGLVYWSQQQPYPLSASIGLHIQDDALLRASQAPVREQISHALKQADSKMYNDKWGTFDNKTDVAHPDVPKNQRLQDLRVRYAKERNATLAPGGL